MTDGTAAGTSRLGDLLPGSGSSGPFAFTAIAAPKLLSIPGPAAPVTEGDAGATAVTFTVTRSGDISGTASAAWAVVGRTAAPASGSDLAGGVLPSGTVGFAAGEAGRIITFNIAGDTSIGRDEGFTVALSAASAGTTIVRCAALATIRNDDPGSATGGSNGADGLDGGRGIDTALFDDVVTTPIRVRNDDGTWTVTSISGGTDMLRDMEFARFANGRLDLATGVFASATSPSEWFI